MRHRLLLPSVVVALFVAALAQEGGADAPTEGEAASGGEIIELYRGVFDETLAKHEEVLVHFHAPCTRHRALWRPTACLPVWCILYPHRLPALMVVTAVRRERKVQRC